MIIFQGRYSWNGKKTDEKEPISWFPGAYDLQIFNLVKPLRQVAYIRPYLCVYTNTGKGYSVSANPEKFAKRICEEFNLQIEKVLWVEQVEPDSERFEIITFRKRAQMGENSFYAMTKRTPLDNEMQFIKKELQLGTH